VIAAGRNPYAHSRDLLLEAVSGLLTAGAAAGTVRSDMSAEDVLTGPRRSVHHRGPAGRRAVGTCAGARAVILVISARALSSSAGPVIVRGVPASSAVSGRRDGRRRVRRRVRRDPSRPRPGRVMLCG
jgi:hypothetical protein